MAIRKKKKKKTKPTFLYWGHIAKQQGTTFRLSYWIRKKIIRKQIQVLESFLFIYLEETLVTSWPSDSMYSNFSSFFLVGVCARVCLCVYGVVLFYEGLVLNLLQWGCPQAPNDSSPSIYIATSDGNHHSLWIIKHSLVCQLLSISAITYFLFII